MYKRVGGRFNGLGRVGPRNSNFSCTTKKLLDSYFLAEMGSRSEARREVHGDLEKCNPAKAPYQKSCQKEHSGTRK